MNAPAAFGPYRVFHQTGNGVEGPVFRAFDSRQDRLVAIKAVTIDLAPERVVRLADAFRALAVTHSNHDAVVPTLDAGIEGTQPFLVMPCQTGETLDAVLRRASPMAVDDARPVLMALAGAIDAAAAAGLRHGNLHPRDVFVDGAHVAVTGFGVVQAFERAEVRSVLHRAYAAPERMQGEAWDTRADVYSLGMIAHELLTGTRATGGREQDGAFAPSASPEQRVQLRRVLSVALAERADDRFQSGATFAEALAMVAERKRPLPPVAVVPPAVVAVETPTERDNEVELAPVELPVDPAPDADIMRALPPHVSSARRANLRPWRAHARLAAVGMLAVGLGAGIASFTIAHVRDTRVEWRAGADINLADETLVDPDADTAPALAASHPAADAEVDVARPVRLDIRSEPSGALVTIDGHRSGETPMTVRYQPGTYVVRVARPGFVPREGRVTLAAARTLTFSLEPAVTPSTPALGWLDIDSRPRGAAVRIDGRLFGPAPLRVPALRPGRHEVSFELGGYERASRQVDVAAGQSLTVNVTLQSLVR